MATIWRNATNDSFVEHSGNVKLCTKINNPKGMLFEYDSEGDPFAISLYGNGNCSGSPTGYAAQYLSKNTSSAIHSYKIDSLATDSSDISITTSPSPTQVTESPTGATVWLRYRSELTGGEIAEIVIGAIVGATIVGGIIFFLARNRQKVSENIVSKRRYAFPKSGFFVFFRLAIYSQNFGSQKLGLT